MLETVRVIHEENYSSWHASIRGDRWLVKGPPL